MGDSIREGKGVPDMHLPFALAKGREGKGVPDIHLPFALAKSEKLTSLEATKRVSPKKNLKFLPYYFREYL